MTDHELKVNFAVMAGTMLGKRPTYAEQVAAEDAALLDKLAALNADARAQVARMQEDARLFGAGYVRMARQEDGQTIVEHVPLEQVHEQLAEGERQAQETLITARLDDCSHLDHIETRRGKVSRLDGQGTVGEVSKLDRTD